MIVFDDVDVELRQSLRDIAVQKAKSRPDKSGQCMLCLVKVQQLEGSHTGSRGATSAVYGKKKEAAFIFYGISKESGDKFQYLLFCDDCEDKFREDKVIPHLKSWGGLLPPPKQPRKPLQAGILFHFVNALFMRQLSIRKWEAQDWIARIFKTLTQFVETSHCRYQPIANLPEVAFFLTKPEEDLWASEAYASSELRDQLANSMFMGTRMPFMNFQARQEHFNIGEGVLEYHFAEWHFYMKEATSAVSFPKYISEEHMLTENSTAQLHPTPSAWPTALLDAELFSAQTSKVHMVTEEFRSNALQRFQVRADVGTPLEQWVKQDYKFYKETIAGHIAHLCQAGKVLPDWTQRAWELVCAGCALTTAHERAFPVATSGKDNFLFGTAHPGTASAPSAKDNEA